MGKILVSIGAISTICIVAACGSRGGKSRVASVSHSTPTTPTPSASPSATVNTGSWWVLNANNPSHTRIYHGTQIAAGNACNTCSYVDGPFTSKRVARQTEAKDEKQARAQLAAQLRAKRRAHRRWLHRTVAYRTDRIVYTVTGIGYPSVQYGSDSNTVDVPGGNGPLGDGVALPFTASQRDDPNALYFAVSAQLEGGGDVTATVSEVQTTVYKDGHSVAHITRLAHAHATGGYAIANAQYNNSGF